MNNEIEVKLVGSNSLEALENTDSTGTFNAVLTGNILVVTGEFSDLTSDVKEDGIDLEIIGEDGNVVEYSLDITDDGDGPGSFRGTFELNESELQAARNHELYINLPTEDNPTGELRGKIELHPVGQIPLDKFGSIDLRDIAADEFVEFDFRITREADFDNIVDFYVVDDDGNALDRLTGEMVEPGEEGYLEAALSTRLGLDFSVDNGETAIFKGEELPGGGNYVPMIVVQGTFEQLEDDDSSNDPNVYFPYAEANADGGEYLRSLTSMGMGGMKFGFEDLDLNERQVAGEPDFDDLMFEVFQPGVI
ncbi:MAG: DUF4114 domain-containing protein [Pleurocapsa sp.]